MARKALYKRALSQRAADRCEAATRPICICRCGGVLHGIGHEKYMEKEKQLFDQNGTIRGEEVDRLVEEVAPVSALQTLTTHASPSASPIVTATNQTSATA